MLWIALMMACSGDGSPQALSPGAKDGPMPVEPDGGIGDGAGPPQGVPQEADEPVNTGPYVVPPRTEATVQADGLTFWGWSEDGSRFAFSTYIESAGGASCDRRVEYYLVDATTDSYVPKSRETWKYASPEGADGCQGAEPWAAHDATVGKLLAAHGIEDLGRSLDLSGDAGGARPLDLPGHRADLSFQSTGPGRLEPQAGSGYRATLSDGSTEVVIEDGQRLRPWTFDYSPHAAFVSPKGAHLALIVQIRGQGYERDHLSWMSNGVALPEAWRD